MSPASFSIERRLVAVPHRKGECLGCGEDTTITHEALTFVGTVQRGPGDPMCAVCAKERGKDA